VATAASPCSAGFGSQLLSGNLITCSSTFKDYLQSSETDQIQSVADNAAANYDSDVANVAQTAADQAESQAQSDVDNVTNAVASSTYAQVFTTCDDGNAGLSLPGLPCIDWTYLGLGVAALVVLYFVAVFSSFIPRGR
jgi:hypothetical protein